MSRSLDDLLPEVREKAEKLMEAAGQAGLRLLVIQTFRTLAEQDALYAQGRSQPGSIVTWARGGESWHNARRAFDVVPLRADGKIWWDAPEAIWQKLGGLGKDLGLTWGGDWSAGKKDLDHFEFSGGLSLPEAIRELNKEQV